MLRNLFVSVETKHPNYSPGNTRANRAEDQDNPASEATLDDLYRHSRSGLRGLLLFLAASALALHWSEQSLAGSLPADLMAHLGSTPSVLLINCVFGASTLSSLISIAGKIHNDLEPGKTSTHLLFRVSFYLLYFISGALSTHFNMVFIAGLVVLSLQHYNAWNYYRRIIELQPDSCDRGNMDQNR